MSSILATSETYVPQTVFNYLQAGNSAKITRVLGTGGWIFNTSRKMAAITTGSKIIASTNSKPYSLGATLYDITLNSNQDTNSCKNSLFSFSSGWTNKAKQKFLSSSTKQNQAAVPGWTL